MVMRLLLASVASALAAVAAFEADDSSVLNGWYACNELTFSDEGSVSNESLAECAIYNAPLCHPGICDDDSDQTVEIFFKRMLANPSSASSSASFPNVWFIQGGPGASSTAMESAMTSMYSLLDGAVNVYTMDHRGTGRSHKLDCVASQVTTTGSPSGSSLSLDEVAECAQELETRYGSDLSSFSITSAATDLSTFISTFTPGETTYVYGVSYGTVLVERLIHLDTDEIEGYIVDGVSTFVGPDENDFNWFSAWDRDFGEVADYFLSFCANDTTCSAQFPSTDVTTTLKNVLADFDANPDSTCAALVRDITSGEAGVAIEPASYTVRKTLSPLLEDASLRPLIPVLTHRLSRCNTEDAKVLSYYLKNSNTVLNSASQDDAFESDLLYDLLVYSEMWEASELAYDVMLERFTNTTISSGTQDSVVMYCAFTQENSSACAEMDVPSYNASPIAYARDEYWGVPAAIPSQASVLIMNGKMDPQTPYKYAVRMLDALNGTNKELVTFDYATHATAFVTTLSDGYTCGMEIVASYVANAGDLSAINKTCIPEANTLSFEVSSTLVQELLSTSDAYNGAFEATASSSSSDTASGSSSRVSSSYKAAFIVFLILFIVALVVSAVLFYRYMALKRQLEAQVNTPFQLTEPMEAGLVEDTGKTPTAGGAYESNTYPGVRHCHRASLLLIGITRGSYKQLDRMSDSREQMLQAAALVISALLTAGGFALFIWIRTPVVDAKRLAEEGEPEQEATFADPLDSNAKTRLHAFGSLIDTATCSLSVIMPAYNEAERILVTIKDTVAYLDGRKNKDPSFTYEIIIVDDCSTDSTVQVVQNEIKKHTIERIRLLQLQVNHGKGGAIRKGVMRARGAKILFADADNATEIRDYAKLEAAMDSVLSAGSQGVIVCGSRAHLEEQAIAKRNPIRNLLMHGFHLIVTTLAVQSVRDTQCGFKLFDRAAAVIVFTPMHIERWAFDVELLYIAAARKLAIKEVAVQWQEIPGSKLSVISASLTMLREIILIRLCYALGIWNLDDGGFRLVKRQ